MIIKKNVLRGLNINNKVMMSGESEICEDEVKLELDVKNC